MTGILRQGLLSDQAVLLVTVPPAEDTPLARALAGLGARITPFEPALDAGEEDGPEWVRRHAPVSALVLDSSAWLPPTEADRGVDPLRELLDRVWVATSAVARGALIPNEAGRVILLTPAHRARATVPAAVAGIENLARTLSVEWARYGITVVAVSPTARSRDEDVATLVAYLLSPAGAYFSGTRVELDGLRG